MVECLETITAHTLLEQLLTLMRAYRRQLVTTLLGRTLFGINSQRKSNKMQQCIKILFHIYMKLNMLRATHRPSPGV